MPWVNSKLGLDEARLDAIKAALVAKISDLNTVLAVSPALAIGATVDATFFRIGDPDTLPDAGAFPFWVCIVGGGRQDGLDFESQLYFTDPTANRGYEYTYHTNLYVYTHPQTWPSSDPVAQAEKRERLRSRICDWIRGDVFNTAAGLNLTLASAEYDATADKLTYGHIVQGYKGVFFKSFGGTQGIHAAHLIHEGKVI